MTTILIVVAAILLIGIIFLNRQSPGKKASRQDFVEKLAAFVEGRVEPMEGLPESYRVSFIFEGWSFVFEDILQKGFKENTNRGYLKVKTNSNLTIRFSERSKEHKGSKIKTPKNLKDFDITSNNPAKVETFFENIKVVRIFEEFKNRSLRGSPTMSLSMNEGIAVLEFNERVDAHPNLISLHGNPSLIENFLDKLAFLAAKV